jgi:hypothetical protein
MPGPIKIERVTLSGFRAYLNEQTFSLLQGKAHRSLAVFAPNAKGKSSFVDAFEFFFSADGTLARLGLRRSSMQAGREALPHIMAEEKGIESAVTMAFRGPQGAFSDKRVINDATAPPASAKTVVDARKLDFIIRGVQLRAFVEHQSPTERYTEVSRWFGLSALVQIQTNLRAVRLGIGQSVESDAATKERLADLSRATGGSVQQWDDGAVLAWINKNLLTPLDASVALAALDKNDVSYKAIKDRKLAEDAETGLLQYEQALAALKRAYAVQPETLKEIGAIPELYDQLAVLEQAQKTEEAERAKSASNAFKDVWEAAQKVLKAPSLPLDSCPVCETPFDKTSAGSKDALSLQVTMRLDSLAAYSKALAELNNARRAFLQRVGNARSALSSLVTALTSAGLADKIDEIKSYAKALEEWQDGHVLPSADKTKAEILNQISILDLVVEDRKQRQGDLTWAKALAKIDELIGIRRRLEHVSRVREELVKLHKSLEDQESFITGRIKAYCQQVIDALRDRVNEIFRAVHPEAQNAPAVRLDLDPEGRRPELTLSFDFAENRKAVAPSGYLSDAQVHTLALSLRLAAIEMFNKDVPVIVLDDVITSYDADHRRAVAAMLAEQFSDHQIIVLTHDERFFVYLKELLPSASWDFKRITVLDPEYGPRLHDHKVADTQIEDLHAHGQSAANEMRQAEEEWLTQMCRDFGTDLRIRDVHKPYSYERWELAQSLANFLKSKGIVPPAVFGVKNQFLTTLVSGQIENFGSHFQDNPNGFGSIGDEKRRWLEFKTFRASFRCACGGSRFKRPLTLNKPVCNKASCELPLAFPTPSAAQSAAGT